MAAVAAMAQDSEVEVPAGYALVFHDEFDKPGRPDSAVWTYEHGYVRNHEAQYYREENAWVEDGCLVIETRKDDAGYPYTSASVRSRGDASAMPPTAWTYGRIEVRAKIPAHVGCWPAIWTLGTHGEWPYCGEVDLMEYYLRNGEETLLANVGWGSGRRYVCRWNSQTRPLSQFLERDASWRETFHLWRMDWDATAIRLYLDGELLNETLLDTTINPRSRQWPHDGLSPFRDRAQYLLLNLALGGDNGGPLTNTPFPCRYLIDYVRVFQKTLTSQQ